MANNPLSKNNKKESESGSLNEILRRRYNENQQKQEQFKTTKTNTTTSNSGSKTASASGSYVDKEEEEQKYSLGKGIAGVARKGVQQVAQGFADTLAFGEDLFWSPYELLTGQQLGSVSDSKPLNRLAGGVREETQAVYDKYASNVEAGGTAAKIFDEYGTATIAAIPQALMALMTAGASATAQTTAGLTQAATKALNPGTVNTVRNAVTSMAKDPNYWSAFAQVTGSSYESAIADMEQQVANGEKQYDNNTIRTKAALQALGNGLMNAAVEVGGGIQKLPSELQGGQSVWKAIVDTAVDEGKEEVVQGVIERAMQNLVYDKGNQLADWTDENAVFSGKGALKEFAGGAVVGGILGGAQIGSVYGINKGIESYNQNRIGSAYNMDINALIDEGLQSDPATQSYQMATRLKSKVDSGKTVSNREAYNLAMANQVAIDAEEQATTPVTTETAVQTATQPVESRVQTIQTKLMDKGMEETQAQTVAASLTRILDGDTTVTNKDKDVLSVGNQTARQVFQEESGVTLPTTNSSTRKTVANYIAQTALKQQNRTEQTTETTQNTFQEQAVSDPVHTAETTQEQPYNVLRRAADVLVQNQSSRSTEIMSRDLESVGTNGQNVYKKYVGNALNVNRFSNAFQRYYDAGTIGLAFDKVQTMYDDAADRTVLYEAYAAGVNDAKANSKTGKANTSAKKTKGVLKDKRTNKQENKVSRKDVDALRAMSKMFKVDIDIVDTIADEEGRSYANGKFENGRIIIAADSNNPLLTVAKHEITHYMQKTAPEQYQAYKNYVMQAFYDGSQNAMNAEIDKRIKMAERNDFTMTREEAMDEIVADATEAFLTDRKRIDALVRENRTLGEKILEVLRTVLNKIEKALRGAQMRGYSDFLNPEQLRTAEKMWVEALASASENGVTEESKTQLSMKDSAGRTMTKEQAEFFKDSKVRDENGNLLVMYHGTPNGSFTIFNDGSYFTANKDYADRYQDTSASSIKSGKIASDPKTFEVYLNIKKPFDISDPDAREIYINEYIKGGNALGINPYLSDKEYSQIKTIDWTEGEDLRDFLIENEYDYDGLVLDEGGDGGYGDDVSYRGKSYVIFRPEQAKNIGNTNPTSDPDIRFSLKDSESISDMEKRLDDMKSEYSALERSKFSFEESKEYKKLYSDIENALSQKKSRFDNPESFEKATEKFSEWSKDSGYNDVCDRMDEIRSDMRSIEQSIRRAKKEAAQKEKEAIRAKYDDEFSKKYASRAARKFGTTSRFDLAGYLTTNGTLLDFSERQGYRVVDHRQVADVLDFLPEDHEYSDGMIEFMNLGNIRLQSYGIDIAKAPNTAQRSKLRSFFRSLNGEVTVDFSNENGGTVGSIEYPEGTRVDKILSDIDRYFETGKVPELSETAMFHSMFQFKENERLLRENEKLRETVNGLKEQFKTTKVVKTDKKSVDRYTRNILKEYNSEAEFSETRKALDDLFTYIANGENGDPPAWNDVFRKAYDTAVYILQNANVKDDSLYNQYYEIIDYLRNTGISINSGYDGDLIGYESINEFRKKNIGRIKITKDGLPVDTAYQELAEMYPVFFDDQEYTNQPDQLSHMEEVLDRLRPVEFNPYEQNMRETATWLANDIIDQYFDLPQAKPTYADVMEGKVANAKYEGKKKLDAERQKNRAIVKKLISDHKTELKNAVAAEREKQKAIQERKLSDLKSKHKEQLAAVRADRDAKLKAEKDKSKAEKDALRKDMNDKLKAQHQKDMEKKNQQMDDLRAELEGKVEEEKQKRIDERERRKERAERTKLLKIAKRLQNMKTTEANRALIDQYTGDLDTVAKSLTEGKAKSLRDLRDWYEDQKANNPDFIPDSNIESALSRLDKKHIKELTIDEVRDLTDVLLNIENEIRTQKKMIDSQERRDIYQMGIAIIDDVKASKGSNPGGVSGTISKYITTESLSPVRQVRRMTGYVDSDPLYVLTNELADGQRKMFDFQRRANERFKLWTEDKKFVDSITGKHAKEIKIVGLSSDGPKEVLITPAMRMSLYLHFKNAENLKHIAGGGVTVPDMKLYKQGNITEAYDRGVTIKLTPSELRTITDKMTTKEKAFADAASEYFNGMSQEEINVTSVKLKGYFLAKVKNYFPINTDTSFTKKEFDAIKFDGTIEGMGFLKERKNSASPIFLRDMNTVLTKSIEQTSRYVGLAIPVRNFNKAWGVTKSSFNEDGSRNSYESSVQQAVRSQWGEDGYQYVENLMSDVNGNRSDPTKWNQLLGKVRSNYAGAVLTLNMSVAMKQAASYPSAAAVLGWKPLAMAMADIGKVDIDIINKYTPLLWYRMQGFSTQELGDMAKRNKSLPKVLNWVHAMDVLTTKKLWKASEYYVREQNKNLKRGTDAYYQAVAEIYNRVIEETQPNYTTMQRPQILRSEDTLLQNLVMFKTQPLQNFNILFDSASNLDAKMKAYKLNANEETKSALGSAKKDFFNAYSSQFVQLMVFAGMTFAWNLFRGKTDDYDDDDGEMTVLTVLEGIGKNMISGAAGMVPFGDDIYEFASSLLTGEKYYGIEPVASQSLSDAVTAIYKMSNTMKGISASAMNNEPVDWKSVALDVDDFSDTVTKLFGIPYENVTNMINACVLKGASAVNGKCIGEYMALQLTASEQSDMTKYAEVLHRAYRSGDYDSYEYIFNDMVANGVNEDTLKAKVYNKVKTSAFTKARNLIDSGNTDEAKALIRQVAKDFGKKYTDLWKKVMETVS